jgi:hypothetical protein
MININSHGHGIYYINLKNPLFLKTFITNPVRRFGQSYIKLDLNEMGYGLDSSGSEYGPVYGYCDLSPRNFVTSSETVRFQIR